MTTEQTQALVIAELIKRLSDSELAEIARKLAARDIAAFAACMGIMAVQPEWVRNVLEALHDGNRRVEAIKAVRMGAGCGLKEAKDAVDFFTQFYHMPFGSLAPMSQEAVRTLRKAYGADYFVNFPN